MNRQTAPQGGNVGQDREKSERSGTGRPLAPSLLDTAIAHCARAPRPPVGSRSLRARSRIVACARDYVHENLNRPISIDAMASAAFTSRRTLHRAFKTVLDESPQSYVRKIRLNRIRRDLASESERRCTVSLVAGRWGIPEMGRLAGWYRDLFGELPSETLMPRVHRKSESTSPSAPKLSVPPSPLDPTDSGLTSIPHARA